MGFVLTLVYIVFVFLRPQELHPELATYQVMNVLAGLAVFGTALSLAVGERPDLRGMELPLGIAFILWSAFSVAAAVRWFGGALTTLYDLSVPFFTFVLVMLNVSTRRRLAVLTAVACGSLGIVLTQAAHAYYQDSEETPFILETFSRGSIDTLIDSAEEDDDVLYEDRVDGSAPRVKVKRIRALGFLADPNDLAQAFVAVIPMVFLPWRRRRPVRNVALVLIPAAGFVWGVLLTRSRGGLVALAALVLIALLYRLRPRARRVATTAALILAAPAFVALFGYAKADSSAYSRLEAWSAGLLMLKASPIWGVGSDFFTEHHNRVAHNSFVQCFAETGLVGYFLWLGLIVVSLQRLSVLAENVDDPDLARWAHALRLSMLGFLLAALFLSRATSPLFFFVVSLPAALLAIAGREGARVPAPRSWLPVTLLLEGASIVVVWITARAVY